MINKDFKIKGEVWLYPGLGGWHFVTLEKKLSEKIRKEIPKGFVKVQAKVGQSSWQTSLFPHKQSESYLLCIKNSIRKKEGVLAGDKIIVSLKII